MSRMDNGTVTLKSANIKWQQFYVSSIRELFFPTGVHDDTMFEIDIGGPTPIKTTIRPVYLYFQNKRWMRDFFIAHELEVGDQLVFWRTGPQSFRLEVRKARGPRK